MDITIIFVIVLILCLAVISALSANLISYQNKYHRAVETNGNVNRALGIATNKYLDSEQERKFLNKQLEMALKGESPNPTLDWLKKNPNLNQKPQDFIDCNPDVDTKMMNKTVMLNKWNAAKLRTLDDSVSFVKLDMDGRVVPIPTPTEKFIACHPFPWRDGVVSGHIITTENGGAGGEGKINMDSLPQPEKQTIDQWYKENGPLDPRD